MQRFVVRAGREAVEDVFHRQGLIEGWRQECLRDARVMVVGAGAIGNEVLKNLALLGVGYLFVVDFDEIDTSNLSRTVLFRREDVGHRKAEVAAMRTRELCLEPGARVDWFHGDVGRELGTGVFQSFDLVLGCVDNLEARLAINRQCWLAGIPWIDAGMRDLATRVCLFEPPHSACFECTVSAAELATARLRYSCDGFKRAAAAKDLVPTTQIAGALVAALQTQEAVRRLAGAASEEARHLHFQGTINDFALLRIARRESCPAHLTYPERVPYPGATSEPLRAFLRWVTHEDRSGPGAVLDISSSCEFVTGLVCHACGERMPVLRPSFRFSEAERVCAGCGAAHHDAGSSGATVISAETLTEFDLRSTAADILDLSLRDVGVPWMAVLPVRDRGGIYSYYQVMADRIRLLPSYDGRSHSAISGPNQEE